MSIEEGGLFLFGITAKFKSKFYNYIFYIKIVTNAYEILYSVFNPVRSGRHKAVSEQNKFFTKLIKN